MDVDLERLGRRALHAPVLDVDAPALHGRNLQRARRAPRQYPARTASSQASHQLPHELASPSARSTRTAPNQPRARALSMHKQQRACPET